MFLLAFIYYTNSSFEMLSKDECISRGIAVCMCKYNFVVFSQRSSARGYYDKFETRSSRAFSLSSSSSSNSSNSASDTEVNPDPKLTENNFSAKPTGVKEVTTNSTTNSTTTVILEHYKVCL